MERKKAAEERRRLEEDKAKVSLQLSPFFGHMLTYPGSRWELARLRGCVEKQAGQRRLITDACLLLHILLLLRNMVVLSSVIGIYSQPLLVSFPIHFSCPTP